MGQNVSGPAKARATTPEIPFDSAPNFLKLPPGLYMGEGTGVATNSKGHVFAFTRSGETRLFEFDEKGTFVKEFGVGSYGFAFAHAVRVDKDDNVWAVDEGTNVIQKFNPDGRLLMVLGKRPDPLEQMGVMPGGGQYSGANRPYSFHRPTDIAWDPQGNIFISDGYCNNRVVKYDKNGRFVAQAGSEKAGTALGEFNLPHGLQVDERGHVWVADRSNNRYQELDNNLKPIKEVTNLGTGWTLCISPGPHQYVFFSNSNPNGNPPGSWDNTGEIYKAELDGSVLGKFGKPGKSPPGFQVVHMLDCRNPNEVVLGEIESWRVQKYMLQPSSGRPSAGR
jgi:DNA-binding beta-propeller fold protein YncE